MHQLQVLKIAGILVLYDEIIRYQVISKVTCSCVRMSRKTCTWFYHKPFSSTMNLFKNFPITSHFLKTLNHILSETFFGTSKNLNMQIFFTNFAHTGHWKTFTKATIKLLQKPKVKSGATKKRHELATKKKKLK